jgi:hypothetical protein
VAVAASPSTRILALDELHAEPGIHADHISVTASDGVIVLSGTPESYREKALVLDHIERSGALPQGVSASEAAAAILCVRSLRVSTDETP